MHSDWLAFFDFSKFAEPNSQKHTNLKLVKVDFSTIKLAFKKGPRRSADNQNVFRQALFLRGMYYLTVN